jgi:hypothetical protein
MKRIALLLPSFLFISCGILPERALDGVAPEPSFNNSLSLSAPDWRPLIEEDPSPVITDFNMDDIVLDDGPEGYLVTKVSAIKHDKKRNVRRASPIVSVVTNEGVVTEPYLDLDNIYIVSGALSYHTSTSSNRDEKNPLFGVRSGNMECGLYDNSRVRASLSYYCRSTWYEKPLPFKDSYFNSKLGLSYYDGKSRYPASLKPLVSIGVRRYFANDGYVDIDYSPGELIGNSGVVTLTIGALLRLKNL